jgi:hypothetical protein
MWILTGTPISCNNPFTEQDKITIKIEVEVYNTHKVPM